ncbi:MAG: DUF6791 domain-containing protein [Bacteroidota bacterium]
MQQQLINLNPDLNRLQDDGYDIEVKGGHLVVRRIPYVTPTKQLDFGTLICILNYASPTKVSAPPDHTIYFCGETPCNSTGLPLDSIINNDQRQQLTVEILVTHCFSSKPITGNYPNYHEKIRTYAEILCIHAKAIDESVTTKPLKRNSK